MTPYEAARLAIADGNMLAAIIAAAGIWVFGVGMLVQNWLRAKAEKRRAEQAADDRKEAAEDRKVTQAMLAALTEILRRTSSPSSQAGPRPGPAE